MLFIINLWTIYSNLPKKFKITFTMAFYFTKNYYRNTTSFVTVNMFLVTIKIQKHELLQFVVFKKFLKLPQKT